MKPLEKSLRNHLEKTVKKARDISEMAALTALEQLGVGEPTPYSHLSEDDRKLRRRLRAHGRQLGNGRDAKGKQELDRLIEEVAYEHWHRMLFARFLAENNLLMYPDPDDPVPVTLEECEDLAADEGAKNGWELASRYAARMLPQIFRPDSPVFQLNLPPEHQQQLERLVAELSQEVFLASDSLGWVYQFWQAKKKDEINASEVKIGARELPAVTQLFTEPYMVSFLLDNSLGAWWAARQLSADDLKNAESEEELRNKASISGVPLEYLRFVRQENGVWTPAAGTFDAWPKHLSELKTLDPCCGSGHFLVAAFLMLVPMRMELEGLSAQEAIDRVLSENIHGLELDQRCVELAVFALALVAWTYPVAGGYRLLPELNVACSGLAVSVKKDDWLSIQHTNANLRIALEEIYKNYKETPVLGSLINPKKDAAKEALFRIEWQEISPILTKILKSENDVEKIEMGVVAKGIVQTLSIMFKGYDIVITNVPYLVRGKHNEILKKYLETNFPNSKHDLAYSFLIRCIQYLKKSGNASVVLPENWLYINPCKKFRENLIRKYEINFLSRLGPGAFQTISGEVVKGLLLSISKKRPISSHRFVGIDCWAEQGTEEKDFFLRNDDLRYISQKKQLENPDFRISIAEINSGSLLSEVAEGLHGQGTFDKNCFVFQFWEVQQFYETWELQQSTPRKRNLFDLGASQIFRWENGKGLLYNFIQQKKEAGYTSGKWKAGVNIWCSSGVAVSGIGYLYIRPYLGRAFDENIAVIHPRKSIHLSAISSFVNSDDFQIQLKNIDSNLKASCNTLVKVPFNLDYWNKITEQKYPKGLPKPYSGDSTQWIFHGHPYQSEDPIQVAICRLLGYRWPAETDPEMELSDESRHWIKKSQKLLPFADEDGIVCIPPVIGETKAEDRLEDLLAAAYGNEWSSTKKAELLAQVNHTGKTLETWLRDKFFIQHCKLFHHRPFIWHIWDGLRDGFAALVNYHKFDRKNLETLIYTYLGDWITRQKQDIGNGVDGAQEKLSAAEALKKKLELILEGEAPYDIFVRWKPVDKQPIGWEPDLNDGVRLNIRPFMTVADVGKKGAGVLRDKPNIKWGKDRGKDVASAPWYHLFKGDSINDYHLSLAEKQAAREDANHE